MFLKIKNEKNKNKKNIISYLVFNFIAGLIIFYI